MDANGQPAGRPESHIPLRKGSGEGEGDSGGEEGPPEEFPTGPPEEFLLDVGSLWPNCGNSGAGLDELSSWFTYFAATAAFGGGVEGTFFWNNHWSGRIILGGDVGVEAGAGRSGALGESYTWVKVINGWFGVAADAAHVAYDAMKLLAPGFNATSVLNRLVLLLILNNGPGVHGSSCPK